MIDLSSGVGRYNLSQFKEPSAIAQGGASMRGAFSGLGEKIMGAIAEPGLKREADAKTAKIQELVSAYNSKSDPKFQNPVQSVNALNLSNVLRPLDPQLSASWLQASKEMAQEEVAGGRELATTKTREEGLTARTMEEQKTKREESAGKKAQQELAMQKVNEATDMWSAKKDDQTLQNMLTKALNDAKLVGLTVPNPIETWIRSKTAEAGTDIRTQQLELQKNANLYSQKMAEANSKRDEERLKIDQKRLAIDARESAEKLKNSPAGSTLDATSSAAISNLQTVLKSLEEIESSLNEFTNSANLTDKLYALKDLKYSANLGSENLGRVQSGGAIQAEEMNTFRGLLAPTLIDFADNGQSYLKNVNKIRASINNKIANLANKGRLITGGATIQQPSASPKKIVNGRQID